MKNAMVFIDFENIVKHLKGYGTNTSKINFFSKILNEIKSEVRVIDVIAYANFDDLDFKGEHSQTSLQNIGISTKHIYSKGKNSSDIQIVVDALRMVYKNNNVDTFVIITNDRDFVPLLKAIKEEGKELYIITFKIGNNLVAENIADKHLFIEDICSIDLSENVDKSNIITDDILNYDIDMMDLKDETIKKAKELSKLLYDSRFWKEYKDKNSKIGLYGYVDVVNRNILKDLDKAEILSLFKIAHVLEYILIWKDNDGMYYLEEGNKKNEVYIRS